MPLKIYVLINMVFEKFEPKLVHNRFYPGFDIKINPGMENGQPKLKMIEYFIINLLLLGNFSYHI